MTKGTWFEAPFTYHGRYFEVVEGGFFDLDLGRNLLPGHRIDRLPYPTLYLDGETDAAIEIRAGGQTCHSAEQRPVGPSSGGRAARRRSTETSWRSMTTSIPSSSWLRHDRGPTR